MYTKKSKISRLPSYITINFIRFQWKQAEQIRAKILKVKIMFNSIVNDNNNLIILYII